MLTADLGLDRDHIVVVEVSSRPGLATPAPGSLRSFATSTERMQRVPGVTAVSYSFEGMFTGGESSGHVTIPGFTAAADSHIGKWITIRSGRITSTSLGAHVLRGRDFEGRDMVANGAIAGINETMAESYFPSVDPIGRTIEMDSVTYTVGAVVRDMEERECAREAAATLVRPRASAEQTRRASFLIARVDRRPIAIGSRRCATLLSPPSGQSAAWSCDHFAISFARRSRRTMRS